MKFPVLSLNQIALGSLIVSVIVLGIKYTAFLFTGSIALYSDALESIINIGTACAAIVAIRFAAQPPDTKHPYGHYKVEYMSAVAVGILIIIAALVILYEAYSAFIEPKHISASWIGLLVSGMATVLNALWSKFLVQQGRLHHSAALTADGKHLMADVITSIGVLVGVVLVFMTGIEILDPVLASLVAINILWSGWKVVTDNASVLIDEEIPSGDLTRIKQIISENIQGALEVHALRSRYAGKAAFVEFHLVVAGSMSVGEAHDICDRIEEALKNEFPCIFVNIHVEPERKAKHRHKNVLSRNVL